MDTELKWPIPIQVFWRCPTRQEKEDLRNTAAVCWPSGSCLGRWWIAGPFGFLGSERPPSEHLDHQTIKAVQNSPLAASRSNVPLNHRHCCIHSFGALGNRLDASVSKGNFSWAVSSQKKKSSLHHLSEQAAHLIQMVLGRGSMYRPFRG